MQKRIIENLQGWRGIGALLILIHHAGLQGSIPASFGDYAVNLFFMLSGFVLTDSHSRREGSLSVGRFMASRLTRIYPVYLAALALGLALSPHVPAYAIPADLLMLQSWIPVEAVYFSGNPACWFVSSLMLCYLLFIPVTKAIAKHPKAVMLTALAGLVAYFAALALIPARLETAFIYIFPPMQFVPFFIGICLWHLCQKPEDNRRVKRFGGIIQIAVVLWIVAQICLYSMIPKCFALSAYWWAVNAVTLLAFTLTDHTSTPLNTLLHSHAMQKFGAESYTFFMLHIPVIRAVRMACEKTDILVPEIPFILLCVLLTWCATLILDRIYTVRATNLLKRLLSPRVRN